MKKFHPFFYLLIAGAFYALGYPIFGSRISLIITPMIGTTILFYYLTQNELSLKRKALYLLTYNFAYNMVGHYWITHTLHEFGEIPSILAFLMATLFSFLITPYLWGALLLTQYTKVFRSSFLGAISLTLLEYYLPQQFPTHLGQMYIPLSQYLGFAHIGGVPLYSFFSYLLVFEVLHYYRTKTFSKFHLATITLFILLNPFISAEKPQQNSPINLRLVQANISNFLKSDSESGGKASVQTVLNYYEKLSTAYHSRPIDLIIWPETAYPYSVLTEKGKLHLTHTPLIFQRIIRKTQSEMLIGGYDEPINNTKAGRYQTEFNSALHFSDKKILKKVYHKHILLPFGETLPLWDSANEYLSQYILNISFFGEGTDYPTFTTRTNHRLISSICYEILRPEFMRTYLNTQNQQPHALLNLTNDSWFGDTAEPEQHLFITKWRAIEFNLPIIRSTNTGISVIVGRDGKEIKRLDVGKRGNLDLTLQLGETSPTLYQRFGISTTLLLWILYFIFHFFGLKYFYDKKTS